MPVSLPFTIQFGTFVWICTGFNETLLIDTGFYRRLNMALYASFNHKATESVKTCDLVTGKLCTQSWLYSVIIFTPNRFPWHSFSSSRQPFLYIHSESRKKQNIKIFKRSFPIYARGNMTFLIITDGRLPTPPPNTHTTLWWHFSCKWHCSLSVRAWSTFVLLNTFFYSFILLHLCWVLFSSLFKPFQIKKNGGVF